MRRCLPGCAAKRVAGSGRCDGFPAAGAAMNALPRRQLARAASMVALLCLISASPLGLHGAVDVYQFASPEQEQRFRDLAAELRCPKCLNTNISGSDAPIAADLRRVLAQQVAAGHTDAQIRRYMLERYGDFILYRPRFTAGSLLLWLLPLVLLLAGVALLLRVVGRNRSLPPVTELDAEEALRLQDLRGGEAQQASEQEASR